MQQQWQRTESSPGSFEEISMERSKGFVKALQELRNLRPQLYSAADYCEKSYLHNEQKQMVLDNLKDYAVRALVNAVDHLGTVAYKLTDLVEQQQFDISSVDLKISCLSQRVLSCLTYAELEGIKQQKIFADTKKHHKHYILPDSRAIHARPPPQPPGNSAQRTLLWHLSSESNTTLDEGVHSQIKIAVDDVSERPIAETFHLFEDAGPFSTPSPLFVHLQSGSKVPVSATCLPTFNAVETTEVSRSSTGFGSFNGAVGHGLHRHPVKSGRSMLSAFLGRNKPLKQRRIPLLTGK